MLSKKTFLIERNAFVTCYCDERLPSGKIIENKQVISLGRFSDPQFDKISSLLYDLHNCISPHLLPQAAPSPLRIFLILGDVSNPDKPPQPIYTYTLTGTMPQKVVDVVSLLQKPGVI